MRDTLLRAAFAAAFACAASAAAARDLPAIRQSGTLKVLGVLDPREPEFFSVKNGAPSGFDLEILGAFAKSLGVRLEVVPVAEWAALGAWLAEGRGDLVAGRFSVTPARERTMAFTAEVFPSRPVVVTRRPHARVTAADQLGKERVGTIRGTSLAEAALAAGVPASRLDDGMVSGGLSDTLRAGRITAAVWASEGAILAQRRDPELELGIFLGPPQSLAYGLKREDTALLAALNDHIAGLRTTGAWPRLVEKHFGAASLDIVRKVRAE
ncbi:MAG: transporter substrate-binding domain-containing protein [Vicinamibacteria bacterium]